MCNFQVQHEETAEQQKLSLLENDPALAGMQADFVLLDQNATDWAIPNEQRCIGLGSGG